jgi:hypothetical protein
VPAVVKSARELVSLLGGSGLFSVDGFHGHPYTKERTVDVRQVTRHLVLGAIRMNTKQAKLELDGKAYALPIVVGSEGEHGVDISTLRQTTGHITLDDGYGNTGSCVSTITYIDGDKGILRYRGYPIEELAAKSTFIEAAYLLIYGELPNQAQMRRFSDMLTENEMLHESMKNHFESFPATAHPMAILLSSAVAGWLPARRV